jgi:hypothetical protein
VVIPSFYAYMQTALGWVMPAAYTGIPLIVVGGVLIVIGGLWGPETRDVDFTAFTPLGADAPATQGAPAPAGELG